MEIIYLIIKIVFFILIIIAIINIILNRKNKYNNLLESEKEKQIFLNKSWDDVSIIVYEEKRALRGLAYKEQPIIRNKNTMNFGYLKVCVNKGKNKEVVFKCSNTEINYDKLAKIVQEWRKVHR